MSATKDTLDQHWRQTAKTLLKGEVGSLWDYQDWLDRYSEKLTRGRSCIGEKEVLFAFTDYVGMDNRIALDEIDYKQKPEPLDSKKIMDFKSLLSVITPRVRYAGNVVLGNSGNIEQSSNVSDSFFIYNGARLGNCKYCAFATTGRLFEECYGGCAIGESKCLIQCSESTWNQRCVEMWMSQSSSDCYYSYGLKNCQDCLFCFNLRNKRYCVGNRQLKPEEYNEIKDRLLAQMRERLVREKKLPSLMDLVRESEKGKPPSLTMPVTPAKEIPFNKQAIETEFDRVCRLVLGRPFPGGIDIYSKWLKERVQPYAVCKSALSAKSITLSQYGPFKFMPKDRLLTQAEANAFGEQVRMSVEDTKVLTLDNASRKIGMLAYLNGEVIDGDITNVWESSSIQDCSNTYCSSAVVHSKYIAYCFWPRSSSYMFGCDSVFDSSFCLKCYRSQNLNRCFECDACSSCADCLFCHNCENVENGLFCFNAKGLRYAVGNVEVGREEFMRIKKMVLENLANELEKKKEIRMSVFSLGSREDAI